jgi:hypothetical protein
LARPEDLTDRPAQFGTHPSTLADTRLKTRLRLSHLDSDFLQNLSKFIVEVDWTLSGMQATAHMHACDFQELLHAVTK